MPHLIRTLAQFGAVCILAACAVAPQPLSVVRAADAGEEWTLSELDGQAPRHASTLTIGADRVHGDAPCNHWWAKLVDDGRVWLGPIAATRAACADLDEEQLLLGSLLATARVERSATRLTLRDSDGKKLAAFERAN